MTDKKRINRIAIMLMGIVFLVLLWLVVEAIRGVVQSNTWNAALITHFVIGLFITLGALVIALILLSSIRKAESPFNQKNVKCLKIIALLLIVYEPYYFLASRVIQNLFPIIFDNGYTVVVRSSLGGVVLVAGLVAYCISLVFQYGISLQEQIDETL